MTDYELYHHGIKGQKWGVRRTAAQLGHRVAGAARKTGTVLYKNAKIAGKETSKALSKAGKATGRFAKKEAKKATKAAIASAKQHAKESKEKHYYKKLHKKKLSQMTDKEIADLTKRVKVEAGLKDAKYESRVKNARKFYNNVAKQPVNTFLASYTNKAIAKAFEENKDSTNRKEQEQKPKNQPVKSNDDNDIAVDFKVEQPKSSKKPKKGTANPYNNPVIIRHGR